jgi:hypothetical protein
MKFQNIDSMVSHNGMTLRGQVSMLFGCRSDSHLSGPEYKDFLMKALKLLKPGGVYLSDGVRESYTRILRYEEVLSIMESPEYSQKYRAFAVVDCETGQSLSVYIEAGVPVDGSYSFANYEALSKTFNFSKVELLPLETVIRRERYEMLLRREIFRELGCNREAFYMVNDVIHSAALYLKCSSPIDLQAGIKAFTHLKSKPPSDPDLAYKQGIFWDAFVDLLEIRLEEIRKESSLSK